MIEIDAVKSSRTALSVVEYGSVFTMGNPKNPEIYCEETMDLWYLAHIKQELFPALHENKQYIVSFDGKQVLGRDMTRDVHVLKDFSEEECDKYKGSVLSKLSVGDFVEIDNKNGFIITAPPNTEKVPDSVYIFCPETGKVITPDKDRPCIHHSKCKHSV